MAVPKFLGLMAFFAAWTQHAGEEMGYIVDKPVLIVANISKDDVRPEMRQHLECKIREELDIEDFSEFNIFRNM